MNKKEIDQLCTVAERDALRAERDTLDVAYQVATENRDALRAENANLRAENAMLRNVWGTVGESAEHVGYVIAASMSARFTHEESAALQGGLEDAALALYQAWVMATDAEDKPLIAHCSKTLLAAQNEINAHVIRVANNDAENRARAALKAAE